MMPLLLLLPRLLLAAIEGVVRSAIGVATEFPGMISARAGEGEGLESGPV
jgi:hypothetical protein